jgi:Protein of unknown function (DUF3500)
MKSFLMRAACCVGGLALICLALKPAREETTSSRIVSAANAFLSTLDDKQRQAALYSFDNEEQRRRWSNFPTPVVPRGGINLKQMSSQQRAAAMELLSIVLSPTGLKKVNEIRMADEDYKVDGSQHRPRNGGDPTERADLQISGQTVRRHNRPAEAVPLTVSTSPVTICSEAISTTSHFLIDRPRQSRGCFNSAIITLH